MRLVFHVWVDSALGVLCWRWPRLATLPTLSGHQGMEGSRFERLGVSRFGCCHQPWRGTRSLGLKTPSGYRPFGVTYSIQHSGGGGGGGSVLSGQGGGEGVSRHEPGVLQDSVALSDATSRSGVTHLEFSVLHRFVDAAPDDAGLSGAASISKRGGGIHGHQVQ